MRCLLAIVIAVMSVVVARADTDLVVLGPAAPDATKASLLADAKQAIDRAAIGARGPEIGPSCAIDPACILATAGPGVRRAAAISITNPSKLEIEVVLVDIELKQLVGKRQLNLRRVGELATQLPKAVDEILTDSAKALFQVGNEHYALGEMQLALTAYKRAYQMKPLPAFLFNIAQCHRKLGQHRDAITMYQSYLVGVPDAANKKLVEELIAESKAAIRAAEQRETERLAELRRTSEAEARAAEERRRAAEERRRAARERGQASVLPWVAIGVGAAAILGGGVLYATSETDDGSQPTYRDTRPAGIGVAIGGAALAGTGVLFVTVF